MSRTKNGPIAKITREARLSPAEKALSNLKYRDLQRACIGRGLEFEEAVDGSIIKLSSWFIKNFDRTQNLILITEFDDWREEQLKSLKNGDGSNKYTKGDAVFHPALKLGFVGSRDDEGNATSTKKPRLKGLNKQKKAQKERIEGTKIFKGTKKAMTYELALQGVDFKTLWEKVSTQFTEAKEKSVKIWYKRALNSKKKSS